MTTPGGKPLIVSTTVTPRSPLKVVAGNEFVFVTEAPLSTEYVEAVPRFTGVSGGVALDVPGTMPTRSIEQISAAVPKTASLSDMHGRADLRMPGDVDWLTVSVVMTLSLDG
jgi:hypothetical protein